MIRSLKGDGHFKEKSIRLGNGQFLLTHLGTKGLTDIDGILHIDYIAEDCGDEGGGIYLFQEEGQLRQVARLSQVSDAGAYYFWEEFIFPEDEEGIAGKILYQKKMGEYFDEKSNWKKSSIETKELVWTNNNLGLAQQ